MTDDGLFDATPVELHKGQRVCVQTIWGDEWGEVLGIIHGAPYPLVHLRMDIGDECSINVARVIEIEEE